ncbi:hypothetical protein [Kribbella sp. NPDC048928]|uniref:hypothetical protein n=1 Tax=Kribbella sp. NPDC048928 TaxID=3364111 RepID=UPI0037162B72
MNGERRAGFLAAQACVLVAATIGLVAFGWASAGLNTYLMVVDPRGGSDPRKALDLTWAAIVVWLSLTLVAAAGLPRRRGSDQSGARPLQGRTPWVQARGGAGAAVVQLFGGLVVIGGTLLGYFLSHPYTFGGPDTPCAYTSCWPLRPQAVALTAPGVVAGLVMIVMAFLVNRRPWWFRAATPAATWLLLLLLQYAIWDPYLLPVFQGPPR